MVRRRRSRQGNVLLLTLFMMIGMLALLAFAVDIGYLTVARTELQRTADSAALAAAWELVDDDALQGYGDITSTSESARQKASQYAAMNNVLNNSPTLASSDVTIGYMSDPSDPDSDLDPLSSRAPNCVHVRVRRVEEQNGEVPFFFAKVLGIHRAAVEAEARAALINNVRGFQPPSDGSNLGILPFTLDKVTWDLLMLGIGEDKWSWDEEQGTVTSGPDGILEVNLYPQDVGAPGNRGTVDIGPSDNSTSDLARQILHGVTKEDLDHIGGKLELNEDGKLYLNGDTGISAGLKDELASVRGRGSIIPVFTEVKGNGNNATYTVVSFVGVRIMEVHLTGKKTSKRVIIQPANVMARGAIPSQDELGSSYFVYSPVWLVR